MQLLRRQSEFRAGEGRAAKSSGTGQEGNSSQLLVESARRLESVLELMRFVVSSTTQEDLLGGLPRRVAELTRVDACNVLRFDPEKHVLCLLSNGYFRMCVPPAIQSLGFVLPIDASLSGKTIRLNAPLTEYSLQEPDSGFNWREFLEATGCQGMLSVPIPNGAAGTEDCSTSSSEPIGCINLYSCDETHRFTREDELQISSVAVSVGQKLTNLRERARNEAYKSVSELGSRHPREPKTLDAIAAVAKSTTNTLAADVFLFNGECLELGGTTGLMTRDEHPIGHSDYTSILYRLGQGLTGYAAATNKSIRVINHDDLVTEKERNVGLNHEALYLHSDVPKEVEQLNILVCPICQNERLYGIVRVIGKPDNRPISKHDQTVIEVVAHQLAACIAAADEVAEREKKLVAERIEAVEKQEEFMATVSHQLRAPLAAMQSHCRDLLSQDMMTLDRWHKVRYTLDTWCQLAANITFNFTSVRKILDAPSEYPVNPQPTSLLHLLKRVAALHQPSSWSRGIGIRIMEDQFDGLRRVEVDESLIMQVFMNLMDNAVKYSERGTEILVELAGQDPTEAAVCVRNAGVPILPDEIGLIFNRDYRTEYAQMYNPVGTGLGLPIAQAIVDLHGGVISVTSRPTPGKAVFRTEFSVRLPYAFRRGKGRTP